MFCGSTGKQAQSVTLRLAAITCYVTLVSWSPIGDAAIHDYLPLSGAAEVIFPSASYRFINNRHSANGLWATVCVACVRHEPILSRQHIHHLIVLITAAAKTLWQSAVPESVMLVTAFASILSSMGIKRY